MIYRSKAPLRIGLAGGGKVRLSAVDKGILKKTKKFSGSSGINYFFHHLSNTA